MPVLIGEGIAFFEKLDNDVALHLAEVKPTSAAWSSFVTRFRNKRQPLNARVRASSGDTCNGSSPGQGDSNQIEAIGTFCPALG